MIVGFAAVTRAFFCRNYPLLNRAREQITRKELGIVYGDRCSLVILYGYTHSAATLSRQISRGTLESSSDGERRGWDPENRALFEGRDPAVGDLV